MAQGAIQGAERRQADQAGLKGRRSGARGSRSVLRQGLDGDGVAVLGGGQDRSARVRRVHRLAGWLFLHLIYPVGFKARLTTSLSWISTFIQRNHRGRLTITEQQAYARADRTTRGSPPPWRTKAASDGETGARSLGIPAVQRAGCSRWPDYDDRRDTPRRGAPCHQVCAPRALRWALRGSAAGATVVLLTAAGALHQTGPELSYCRHDRIGMAGVGGHVDLPVQPSGCQRVLQRPGDVKGDRRCKDPEPPGQQPAGPRRHGQHPAALGRLGRGGAASAARPGPGWPS